MINNQTIPCPTCKTGIPFDVQQLLQGMEFICPNCQGSIGLSQESKPLVSETIDKFNEMKKQNLSTNTNNNPSSYDSF